MRTTLLPALTMAAMAALLPAQTAVPATATQPTTCRIVHHPALPRAITSFGACCSGGWLYVFGGHVGREHRHTCENVVGTFQRLNLADGTTWQSLPDGPALQGTALVAGPDGRLWRVGGMTARNAPGSTPDLHSTSSVARFDPVREAWEEGTPLPEPRSSHDAVVVGHRLVVCGGWTLAGSDEGQWLRTVWSADLRETPLTWTALPPLDHDHRAVALAAFGERLVVLGGIGPDGLTSTVRVLEPGAGEWTSGPELPGGAFGTAAAAVGERLFATVAEGRVVAWDGGAAWTDVAQLAMPRFFHRLIPVGDTLLALGGAGRGGHTRSIEPVAITTLLRLEFTEITIPSPGRVAYRQALLLQGNTLFAFGGNRGGADRFAPDQFADDVWRVDLLTQSAARIGTLPMPVQSMAATAWNAGADNVLIGGLGVAEGQVRTLPRVLRWNAQRGQIGELADVPTPRTQGQVVHHAGELWLLGGTDFVPDPDGGTTTDDMRTVFVANAASEHPAFVAADVALPRARRSFGAAVLGDKLLLIGGLAGGFAPAGPGDVFDFTTRRWTELETPVAWVSPETAVIGRRVYVACGGTMRGQRFTEDRSLWSWSRDEGWHLVVADLPFPVRHVQMLAWRNRLLFWSTNDPRGDRIVIRTVEPDRRVFVAESAMHR